jgi:hypothetical protein
VELVGVLGDLPQDSLVGATQGPDLEAGELPVVVLEHQNEDVGRPLGHVEGDGEGEARHRQVAGPLAHQGHLPVVEDTVDAVKVEVGEGDLEEGALPSLLQRRQGVAPEGPGGC